MSIDIFTTRENVKKLAQKGHANDEGGGFSNKNYIANILYTAQQQIDDDWTGWTDRAVAHERQHQVNRVTFHRKEGWKHFLVDRPGAGFKLVRAWLLKQFAGLFHKDLSGSVKDAEIDYLHACRNFHLTLTKDEIIAYFRSHRHDENFITGEFFTGEHPAYDYKRIFDNDLLDEDYPGNKELVEKIIIEQYESIVKLAINACEALAQKYYSNYPDITEDQALDQAIARLRLEPLQRWPRIADEERN